MTASRTHTGGGSPHAPARAGRHVAGVATPGAADAARGVEARVARTTSAVDRTAMHATAIRCVEVHWSQCGS
ncbi:MAG: hypothetical protein ACOYXM_10145 [Actinomycetota bacterium]